MSCCTSTTYLQLRPINDVDPTSSSHMLPLFSMSVVKMCPIFLLSLKLWTWNKSNRVSWAHSIILCRGGYSKEMFAHWWPNYQVSWISKSRLSALNKSSRCSSIASKFLNSISIEDLQKVDDEWRELQFMDRCDLLEYSGHKVDVGTVWGSVGTICDTSGGLRFQTVGKLTKSLLSVLVLHSNVDVARIFSHVNLIKVKQRNQLNTSTLDALLVVKQRLPCDHVLNSAPI